MYRCTGYVGAHFRLSDIPRDQLDSAQAKGICFNNSALNDLVSAISWKTRSSYRFTKSHHINLQELRALAIEVRRYAREAPLKQLQRSVRQVVLLDSAVCVDALGRCRSSSYKLNEYLDVCYRI